MSGQYGPCLGSRSQSTLRVVRRVWAAYLPFLMMRAPSCSHQCQESLCTCTHKTAVDGNVLLLQDGAAETGVSVAFTVRAMDAGPILAQEHVAVDDAIQAPELLESLFRRGMELLIRQLPLVWDGRARQQALPQVSLLPVSTLCALCDVRDTSPCLNGTLACTGQVLLGRTCSSACQALIFWWRRHQTVRHLILRCRLRQRRPMHPR